MEKTLVTLVNPNKIHPGITPYALDILTTSLEENGFDVEVVDLTFKRDTWKSVVREYFSSRRPILVGFTIRNTDTIYPQEQRNFLEDHLEIINEVKQLTRAPMVVGGVGFSSMPFALLEYFDIPYGVKGPGELILCKLANALLKGESPRAIPGLLINDAGRVEQVPGDLNPSTPKVHDRQGNGSMETVNSTTPYVRRSGVPWKVDNLEYYSKGGLGNFLTKNGCPYACTHCVEPDAKGHRFSKRNPSAVVDELEMLARQGVYDVHSTDSEFNLDIEYGKQILKEIVNRKSSDPSSPLWDLHIWLYCQPAPFDEEFADLLSEAGCQGVNISPDHTCPEMLGSWKVTGSGRPFYTFEDMKEVNRLLGKNGILVMIEIMIGMPGETIDTLHKCIDESLALNATVVGYTLGIRIFPYSALGIRFAAESDGTKVVRGLQSNTAISPIRLRPMHKCRTIAEYERQFMFDEYQRLRPLYYFSPDLPEDPETIDSPNARWMRTLQHMREYIPEKEHYRVMLPTAPGLSKDDNNYADNPFLLCLARLGYKGAYWARWRQRDQIMQQAFDKGLVRTVKYDRYIF